MTNTVFIINLAKNYLAIKINMFKVICLSTNFQLYIYLKDLFTTVGKLKNEIKLNTKIFC